MRRTVSPAAGSNVAFLVGAGRSGTTLLYKLLCLHPRVAYITNYENRLAWCPDGLAARAVASRTEAKLRAWFGRGGNAYFIDRPWLKKLFPTPHEGESVYAACGVPLYPLPEELPDARTAACLQERFARIRRRAGGSVLLSKRTANNRRVRYLAAAFPEARFVHLVRDGREVAQSLAAVEWWDQHRVWWDGRTALEIERDGTPRLAICARNWVRELEELRAQLADVPARNVLELRFEQVLREPVANVAAVTRFLGLQPEPGFLQAITALGLKPATARWDCQWDRQQLDTVLRETQPMLRQLGYCE